MKKTCGGFIFFLCTAVFFCSCSRYDKLGHNRMSPLLELEEKPLIAVSILPQSWFVDRISGGRARTLVLAGHGQTPHNYEPSPRQVSDLAGAKAWILCGMEFEMSLRPKIAALFPSLFLVDGTEGVAFRSLEEHDGEDADNVHSETEIDRHTWLGQEPAKILAVHIRDVLSFADLPNANYYTENCEVLLRDIDLEFATLRGELAPLRGRTVFVYHPSFGYFFDEFGIRQEAVETGGKEPGPRELNRLIALAKRESPAAIFVQAQFPVNVAKTIADAVGAELVSLDPLAADWLANIRLMGGVLKASITAGKATGGGD